VPKKVTYEMRRRLGRPFNAEEVEKVLLSMGLSMRPSKAPGADCFTAGFYQKHWQLIKEDVTMAVRGFFRGGHLPGVTNMTIIVLIPKVKNPQEIGNKDQSLYVMLSTRSAPRS
jgi:hypothetical protein